MNKSAKTVGTATQTKRSKSPKARIEPVWKSVVKIGSSIPENAWDKMPADASLNVDHYLYGTPKSRK